MAEAMKTVAIKVGELTAKEKVLLSVGYKKVLGPSRSSWRKLSRMLNKESDITKTTGIIEYRNKLEKEITDICTDVVSIIDGIYANAAAYYYKMKGDFIRYLAEFRTGDERKAVVNSKSFEAYETATDIINRAKLPPTNPIRLSVALNFSVFYYEILGLRDRAIEIARVALDEASSGLELDRSNEEAYKCRDNIMQHLRDNMIVWREAEMAEAMKSVAIKVAELTAEEKVLLSVGYKKVLGPRRASWRKLSSMLKEESNMNKTNRIIECRNKVEKEMSDIYTDIVLIIECILIPSSEDRDPNSAAFYYKMKGDFIRYLAEFKTGNERRVAANQSFKAYETATDIINRAKLPATSPIRLGVALNFSVFYRKILGFT